MVLSKISIISALFFIFAILADGADTNSSDPRVFRNSGGSIDSFLVPMEGWYIGNCTSSGGGTCMRSRIATVQCDTYPFNFDKCLEKASVQVPSYAKYESDMTKLGTRLDTLQTSLIDGLNKLSSGNVSDDALKEIRTQLADMKKEVDDLRASVATIKKN